MLTAEKLFWLSGLALAIGGSLATVSWLIFAVVDPQHQDHTSGLWLPLNFFVIGGGLLMALGLPGFYVRQAPESGLLGLVAFVVFFVGLIIPYVAVHSIQTVTMPQIPPGMRLLVTVGAPSLFLGAILTAVVTWQVGLFPQWIAAALAISVVLGLVALLVPLPPWLGRNVITAVFTVTMAILGVLQMSLSNGP